MKCKYLEGENIAPGNIKEAKALIGKRVEYLEERDIDKSGRGYFFPKRGFITNSINRELVIDGNYINRSSLREMIELVA